MSRALLFPLLFLLAACSAPQAPPDIAIAPGQYAAGFDAAKSVITGYRFELERIDARAGVITTRPKHTAGFATPWDREQTTLGQDWEDLLNDQQRTVRITFEPVPPMSPPPSASVNPQARVGGDIGAPDLRETRGPVIAHVDVVLERAHRSGQRLEPTAVQLSAPARDPELERRGLWPVYHVAFSQDPDLARRLAEEIRRRLSSSPTPP